MLKDYRHYESRIAVNFVPLFPSEVSRISVNKEAISIRTGNEIIVMYIDGMITRHSFHEFESILHMIKNHQVITYEIS
jgi:ArsR family metal-binding transcriptional regulator